MFLIFGVSLAFERSRRAVAEVRNYNLSPGNNALQFGEPGVSNYSTMLLREDLEVLVLGARGAVFALHLSNISNKQASVRTPLLTVVKVCVT